MNGFEEKDLKRKQVAYIFQAPGQLPVTGMVMSYTGQGVSACCSREETWQLVWLK